RVPGRAQGLEPGRTGDSRRPERCRPGLQRRRRPAARQGSDPPIPRRQEARLPCTPVRRSRMNLLDFFRERKKKETPAAIAKERLQIIVAHERGQRNEPDYLPALPKELVEVIRKYVNIDQDQVQVALEDQGSCSILELNITLPDRCAKPVSRNGGPRVAVFICG